MSAETKTERVLRDVLNSDNLRDFLGGDVVNNAMKWRFLRAALIVLDGHGLLGDPDAVKDATPAPLDPKLVHVGDTVTVRFIETGEEITTKAYQPKDLTADSEWVYILGWPLNRPMGHGLAVKYFEILDHQPAPEPEPEWKPGTSGWAVVSDGDDVFSMRVMRVEWDGIFGFATESGRIIADEAAQWSVSDFVPDEPRPLPTRGELYAALTHSDVLKTDPRSGLTYIDPNLATERLAVFLRGESR